MLCRSQGRAETARAEIQELTKSDNVNVLLADLGELSQVRKVVEELQSKETKVDCLVCNAGLLLNDRQETSEGNEMTFAVHLLGGSYLLSQLLLPQLRAAGDQGRVVFVASGGMYSQKWPASWDVATSTKDSPKEYFGSTAYAYAKRGQVLLAERLSQQTPEIAWVSGHPGWTQTDNVDDNFGDFKEYLKPLREPWQGAEGLSWCMATDRKNLESGAFYLDRQPQRKHVAGPFFTEGSFTKNSAAEVDSFMENLKKAAGL